MDTFRGSSLLERGESSRQPTDGRNDKPRPKKLRLLRVCDRLSEFLSRYNGVEPAKFPLRSHFTLVGRNIPYRGIAIPLEGLPPLIDAIAQHGDFLAGCSAPHLLKSIVVGDLSLVFLALQRLTLANCSEDLLLSMRDVVRDALRLGVDVDFLSSYIRGLAYHLFRFRGFDMELSSLSARVSDLEHRTSSLRAQLMDSERLLSEARITRRSLEDEQKNMPLPEGQFSPLLPHLPLSHGLH